MMSALVRQELGSERVQRSLARPSSTTFILPGFAELTSFFGVSVSSSETWLCAVN